MKPRLAWMLGGLVALVANLRNPSDNLPPPRAAGEPTGAAELSVPVGTTANAASGRRPEPDPLMASVRRGEDPLLLLARDPEERARRNDARIKSQLDAARIRGHQERVVAQSQKFFEEHRARLREAGFDPDQPGPRLFPSPVLGETVEIRR